MAVTAPALRITSTLKGVKLVKRSVPNTYKLYAAKTVTITVATQAGCTYYYKIAKRGQDNRELAWKKLSGNQITISASSTAKRVYLKAVNQVGKSTIRKTPGFYVDTKKPVVKGVKANKVYRKTVKLSFSDNIGVKTATLNGKKITSGIRVSKKGTYQLIVTDKAGNKTKVKFKIK